MWEMFQGELIARDVDRDCEHSIEMEGEREREEKEKKKETFYIYSSIWIHFDF